MKKHTSGKIEAVGTRIYELVPRPGRVGQFIRERILAIAGVEWAFQNQDEAEANAARMVACWNACESVADPSIVPELVKALREGYLPVAKLEELRARIDGKKLA